MVGALRITRARSPSGTGNVRGSWDALNAVCGFVVRRRKRPPDDMPSFRHCGGNGRPDPNAGALRGMSQGLDRGGRDASGAFNSVHSDALLQ